MTGRALRGGQRAVGFGHTDNDADSSLFGWGAKASGRSRIDAVSRLFGRAERGVPAFALDPNGRSRVAETGHRPGAMATRVRQARAGAPRRGTGGGLQ